MSVDQLKILFLGDVFGEPGRRAIKEFVPKIKEEQQIDLAFANVENAARGKGISTRMVRELQDCGIDAMTGGNHILAVGEIYPYLNRPDTKVLRPYNFSKNTPGKGCLTIESKSGVRVGLINLMGRAYMEPGVNLPFDAVDDAMAELQQDADIFVVDMHAEATAEKRALGWHLNGKAQLVVGTHTHVQTADEEILSEGTGYITDLGMCGPYDSVIGINRQLIVKRFRTGLPQKFEVASDDIRLCGVICHIDVSRKRATKIERVCERLK